MIRDDRLYEVNLSGKNYFFSIEKLKELCPRIEAQHVFDFKNILNRSHAEVKEVAVSPRFDEPLEIIYSSLREESDYLKKAIKKDDKLEDKSLFLENLKMLSNVEMFKDNFDIYTQVYGSIYNGGKKPNRFAKLDDFIDKSSNNHFEVPIINGSKYRPTLPLEQMAQDVDFSDFTSYINIFRHDYDPESNLLMISINRDDELGENLNMSDNLDLGLLYVKSMDLSDMTVKTIKFNCDGDSYFDLPVDGKTTEFVIKNSCFELDRDALVGLKTGKANISHVHFLKHYLKPNLDKFENRLDIEKFDIKEKTHIGDDLYTVEDNDFVKVSYMGLHIPGLRDVDASTYDVQFDINGIGYTYDGVRPIKSDQGDVYEIKSVMDGHRYYYINSNPDFDELAEYRLGNSKSDLERMLTELGMSFKEVYENDMSSDIDLITDDGFEIEM